MKVLFDHNLPHKLRNELGALCRHEIVTTSYMGWRKLKNGELLRAAEENGFDVFVTGDRTLVYEQNLVGRRLTILTLSANNWPIIKAYIAEILAAINSAAPGSFQTVNCGTFSRRNSLTSEEWPRIPSEPSRVWPSGRESPPARRRSCIAHQPPAITALRLYPIRRFCYPQKVENT